MRCAVSPESGSPPSGRGNENLTLAIIDAGTDQIVDSLVIVDRDHPHRPGRARRKAAAEALLAKRPWRRLVALDLRDDPRAPARWGPVGGPFQAKLAVGQGLRITYREPALIVRETGRNGLELLKTKATQLSYRDSRFCKGCECPPQLATMAGAFVDRASGVLLLVIGYSGGSDICLEREDTFHIIHLPL